MSTYHVLATLFPSSLTTSLPGRKYYPHVTAGETEVQSHEVTLLMALRQEGAGLGTEATLQTEGNICNLNTRILKVIGGLGAHLYLSSVVVHFKLEVLNRGDFGPRRHSPVS